MNRETHRMHKAVRTGFAALAFTLAAFARAADDGITAEKYPDADAVMVDCREEVAYNADGSFTNTATKTLKILTERGRRNQGTLSLRYSQRYGTARILSVSVIGEDGAERAVDFAATLKDATSNASVASNIYDPMDRVLTCQIPGLKIGDSVRYATQRVAVNPRVENVFAGTAVFEWSMPILKSVYSVKAPAALPLKSIAVRHPIGNVSYEKKVLPDGATVHEWTAENSPQAFPEPHMPPLATEMEKLLVSTAGDWREISDWYWRLSLPHMEKTTGEMTNLVETLGRDIDKIRIWVAENIRYMGLTMEDKSPGYAPHDIDITFNNRYGVCRDKAALLAALLRIAGHEAYPVLIHVGAKMDPDVPTPFFNHAIVAVADASAENGYRLMDPTPETSRAEFPAYLCNRSYLVAKPGGETLLVSGVKEAAENRLTVRTKGKIRPDLSAVLETKISFGGSNDASLRRQLMRMNEEEIRRHFASYAASIAPDAELVTFDFAPKDMSDLSQPLEVSFMSRVPEIALEGESTFNLSVPEFSSIMGTASKGLYGRTSLDKRRFTLELSATSENDEEVELELPSNFGKPVFLPEAVKEDGGYSFLREYGIDGNTLKFKTRLSLNALEFPPGEYPALLDAVKKRAAAVKQKPVFGKNRLADAKYRNILWKREFHLTSPRSWVATNVFVKEILSYDAKKLSSDLHWTFVPCVENFRLVSASVATPGKPPAFVGEHEKNVMDDSWVAKAPRYPPVKSLVANLPSVEIGSVTTVTTVTEVVNSPMPFRGEYSFDSDEPFDEIDISVSYLGTNIFSRCEKNVKRIPHETVQPPAVLWRDVETVSLQTLEDAAAYLRKAATDEGVSAPFELDGALPPSARIAEVRNWMSRNVRIIGPSLHYLPLDAQLTAPETVLAERYATRLDYMRAMAALMKGAGLEADVVFARMSGGESPEIREFRREHPNYSLFNSALCRVRAEGKEFFVGAENEYSPVGATEFEGSEYIDPAKGEIATVTIPDESLKNRSESSCAIRVRADGSADCTVETRTYGSDAGTLRKFYAEILPEDRARRHLALVKQYGQSAVPVGDFVTDTESYPMTVRFAFRLPDYAVAEGDMLNFTVPGLRAESRPIGFSRRLTPYTLKHFSPEKCEVTVSLPDGYSIIERCPLPFRFDDKEHGMVDALETGKTRAPDGTLELHFVRTQALERDIVAGPEHAAAEKGRNNAGTRRGIYTVTVRKGE